MGCKHVTDGARGGRVTATCPDRFMLWPQVLQWEWGFVECRVLDLRAFNQGVSADELQRLRDGMVRQQKRHAEEMADLQRAHQKEMSVFAKLVEVSVQVF